MLDTDWLSGCDHVLTSLRNAFARYYNNLDIKLIFSSFKIGTLFSAKDPIPSNLHSSVVYKFSCANCNACYFGETTRHFSTRAREHGASHVYKHLQQSESCRNLCSASCFSIIDYATTSFQLKIKESLRV